MQSPAVFFLNPVRDSHDEPVIIPVSGNTASLHVDVRGSHSSGVPVRYAVGSNTGLQYEDDGSLIIYMSANPPEGVSLSNWLPVPEGNFEATLRMYDPASEILSGDWQPPKIVRTGSAY